MAENNGEEHDHSEGPTLASQFRAFSKFGDSKSDGKMITLSQSDKWMKQAGVIDKKITTTDTGIHFKKFKLVSSWECFQTLASFAPGSFLGKFLCCRKLTFKENFSGGGRLQKFYPQNFNYTGRFLRKFSFQPHCRENFLMWTRP